MKPVFILGNMRSGTTILHKTLLRSLEGARDIQDSDMECRPFWMKHHFELGTPLSGTYCRAATPQSVSHEDKARIQAAFQRMSKRGRRVVTKNTHFSNKIPLLNDLFPNALYVHIVRQDFSVVASMKEVFTRVYQGENPWRTPCVHFWPTDDRPCWCVVPTVVPPATRLLRERLRRSLRRRTLFRKPVFVDWSIFQEQHPDPTRYFPGEGFSRLEESWIQSNLNILLDVEKLNLAKSYLPINYRSLVEDPQRTFLRISEFLGASRRKGCDFGYLCVDRQDKWRTQLTDAEVDLCKNQRRALCRQVDELCKKLPGPLLAE
jgi:hypothetical protein